MQKSKVLPRDGYAFLNRKSYRKKIRDYNATVNIQGFLMTTPRLIFIFAENSRKNHLEINFKADPGWAGVVAQ